MDRIPAPLWRRRRLLIALAVLIAVRAALPVVVRRVLVSQASQALRARVTIGDVDLALLRLGIALKEVAVRPATPAAPDDPPLIAWKRFAVGVRWLPLLRHTIRLRTLELEAPRIALERLADGQLNLTAFLPPASAPPQPEPPPPPPSRWRFGADRVALRDGLVRFRDLQIGDHEPIELGIDGVDVAEISLQPGVYDEAAHLRLDAAVQDGRLHVDARLTHAAQGLAVAATVRARKLPLQRARFYVPDVGWSELRGSLDAAIKYRLEPGRLDRVYGSATLAGLAVQVPGVDEPALGWRTLTVRVSPVDLLGHRAAVTAVALDGASVLVRPQGGDLLPFLAHAASHVPAAAEAPPAEEKAAPGAPWRWAVASARVSDTHVHLLGTDAPVDVGVTLVASRLAGDGGGLAPVDLTLAVADGLVHADGNLRVAPPGFAGKVTITGLALPELIAAAGALPAGLLQAGTLGGELTIEAGLAAEGAEGLAGGDVRVRGALALTKPWLAGPDPNAFLVGGGGLSVAMKEIRVPGALGTASAGGPLAVTLGEVRLDAPVVRLTRGPTGLDLPAFAPAAAGKPEPPAAPPPAAAPATAAPAMTVALDALHVSEGEIRVTDRTVTPFYQGDLSSLAIEASGIRWPPPAVDKLHLTTRTAEKGQIDITGTFAPAGGSVVVNGKDIPLMPFNPYATSFSGYSVGGGRLTLVTHASYGKGRYDATTSVTLQRFALRGGAGESLFQQNFGIPLEMALALMRDVHGNIDVDVPLAGDAAGAHVDLLTVVGGALRRAIVNALASPLKLAGMVFGEGSSAAIAPAPITFLPGQATVDKAGDAQLTQLASFLASRPGVAVSLDGTLTQTDVRWLREQALRAELGAGQGVLGTLRTLPQRGTRDTIRKALEARAAGQEGALSPDDAATLERWLAERPPPTSEDLQRLIEARVARVETELRERHGIEAARITRATPAAPRAEGAPGVQVGIGAL